ncbi:unnamed protein product, partial [Gulo gulo]
RGARSPAFVRAAPPAPASPAPPRLRGVLAVSHATRRLGSVGAQAPRGGGWVAGCPLTPPGSPERLGLQRSVAKSRACDGSRASAEAAGRRQGWARGRRPQAMRRTGLSLSISGLGTHATLTCSTEELPCQVKGNEEKAEASLAGRNRRNRKWTFSAQPPC